MSERKKSNLIPIIHRLVTDENGENYWFNGCAKYVMECLGERIMTIGFLQESQAICLRSILPAIYQSMMQFLRIGAKRIQQNL